MNVLLTASQAKEADRYSIEECGMPSLVLMERAALEVVRAVREKVCRGTVFVLCGTGNNGADGLAAARMLSQKDYKVLVCLAGNREKATEEWKTQERLLKHCPVKSVSFFNFSEDTKLPPADVYIDALFGIGLKRTVEGLYAAAIDRFNAAAAECGAYRIAVDIPSGISADTGSVLGTACQCDATITFGWGKAGQYLFPGASYCGKVCVKDIGFFNEAAASFTALKVCDREAAVSLLPERKPDANKGSCGRAVIIAGSPGMSGAALLCAAAAYRSGAGLVEVITCKETASVLQQRLPEAVVSTLPEEGRREWLKEKLLRASSAAIGPGLSVSDQAHELFAQTISAVKESCPGLPLVIDADGLNILAMDQTDLEGCETVLTPHPGELSRLLGKPVPELTADLRGASKALSEKYGAAAVCKDARTVITTPDGGQYLNITGNDGMAVGGSGDVLTGVIAGLLAQGCERGKAAVLGVYLHGRAGDLAAEKGKRGLLAGEIADKVREAVEEIDEKNTCKG